jgi:hypothetical protein
LEGLGWARGQGQAAGYRGVAVARTQEGTHNPRTVSLRTESMVE